jgi:superfamily II DNA or RNA helicase
VLTLRDYQTRDHAKIRAALEAARSVVYVSPTGSGKTRVTCRLIDEDVEAGKRVGFIAHRKELIDQCSKRLNDHSIAHGIIMRGHAPDYDHAVQVASIQTLVRREAPALDILYVDEAHHAPSDSYQGIISAYPNLVSLVGLTATPCRLDGRGLGCFQEMVIGSTAAELTQDGWLVPAKVYAPSRPDLTGVHTRAGDYIAAELQAAMDKPKLTGDIIQHWFKLAEGMRTVVYASGVTHSRKIVDEFIARGVPAAHLDATTKKTERERILNDLEAKRLLVVSNCGILTEGWDCPSVACIILARPTKSLALYLQMVGRALRPSPDKTYCLVLDHAGATLRHGFVTEDREWTLDGAAKPKKPKDDSQSVRLCLNCYNVYESSLGACPECKWAPPVKAREVKSEGGDLVELDPACRIKKLSKYPAIRHLQLVAAVMGYKPGWVFFQLQRMRRGLKPDIPKKAIELLNERNRISEAGPGRVQQTSGRAGVETKYRRRLQSSRSRQTYRRTVSAPSYLRSSGGCRYYGRNWASRPAPGNRVQGRKERTERPAEALPKDDRAVRRDLHPGPQCQRNR